MADSPEPAYWSFAAAGQVVLALNLLPDDPESPSCGHQG
jgi:hypothetical protein